MRAFVRKYEVFVKTKLTVKPIDWKTIKDQDFIDDFVRYCFKNFDYASAYFYSESA